MSLYTVGAQFDERRNTSRVFEPIPEDEDARARRVARFRKQFPRFVRWVEAGAPAITSPAEHVEWFGVPYKQGELT